MPVFPPVIVITQGASTTSGVPNVDILIGGPPPAVTFSLTDVYTTNLWQLISRPVDSNLTESTAVLSFPQTNPTVTITPDLVGTYKVRYIANGGVGLNTVTELWFYARNFGDPLLPVSGLPRRHPAFTEATETAAAYLGAANTNRGATTELDAWFFILEEVKIVIDSAIDVFTGATGVLVKTNAFGFVDPSLVPGGSGITIAGTAQTIGLVTIDVVTATFALLNDMVADFFIRVVGIRNDIPGSAAISLVINGTFFKTGIFAVTQIGSTNIMSNHNNFAGVPTADFTIASPNVTVNVTGIALTTIDWQVIGTVVTRVTP